MQDDRDAEENVINAPEGLRNNGERDETVDEVASGIKKSPFQKVHNLKRGH